MTFLARIWSSVATVGEPAFRVLLALRVRRGKERQARLSERWGLENGSGDRGDVIWLHAASVGETVSLLPVIRSLGEQAQGATLLVTTGTLTSADLLAQRMAEQETTDRVLHRFVPLDVPRWIGRFLDQWHPRCAVFVESELWPNTLAALRKRSIPTMLLNARMSDRSFKAWSRVPGLAREVLSSFSVIYARNQQDAERFRALASPRVVVAGDLKFAADPLPADPEEVERLELAFGDRPAWLAASTHPGEEAIILQAHGQLLDRFPNLLTIVVPRHPARGPAIRDSASRFAVRLRSLGEDPAFEGSVWIADTLGELGLFYRLCSIVFVGRSLIPPGGGQNPLEPARLACALAAGPFTGNFDEAVDALTAAGALARVEDADSLASWVGRMLDDTAECTRAGHAALDVADRDADLPDRLASEILGLSR